MSTKSVGKTLEERRKELGLTVEQCSANTRISKKFLEALESDAIDQFPGEAYYTGFLRTYANMLGLKADELVKQFEKQKKIEQPAPTEELTKPLNQPFKINFEQKKNSIVLIGIIAAIFILATIFVIAVIPHKADTVTNGTKQPTEIKDKKNPNEAGYLVEERREVKSFKQGEKILIPNKGSKLVLTLLRENPEDSKIVFEIKGIGKEYELGVGQSFGIDLNRNGQTDFQLTLNSFDVDGANLTLERLTSETSGEGISENDVTISGTSTKEQGPHELVVVVTANAGGYVKIVSDTDGEVEKYLAPGESLKLSGKDKMEIHLTNAGHMTVLVNNQAIQLPQTFLVFAKLQWAVDASNNYTLQTEFKE